jgi:hypothetical protein
VTEVETELAAHRTAVEEFVAAARAIDRERWTVPRADGAWSPGQIAEHLAIFYDYSRKIARDEATSPIPWLLRPLVSRLARAMIVDNTLKAGRFTRKGRAPGIFQPSASPPPADLVLPRLDAAVRGLESDIRSRHPEARHTIQHPIFGTMAIAEWVRLQAIHARNHRAQLPTSDRG